MADISTLSPEEIKTLKDFLNLGRSLTSSLTSSQIASFASDMGEILPLLQTLSNPGIQKLLQALTECSDTLVELIQLVNTYHKAGTIRKGLELASLMGVVRDALSTRAVAKLAEDTNAFLVTVDQAAAQFGGLAGIQTALESAKKASKEAAQDTSSVGLMRLLKILREPQVQRGVKFLLHFAKHDSDRVGPSLPETGINPAEENL